MRVGDKVVTAEGTGFVVQVGPYAGEVLVEVDGRGQFTFWDYGIWQVL